MHGLLGGGAHGEEFAQQKWRHFWPGFAWQAELMMDVSRNWSAGIFDVCLPWRSKQWVSFQKLEFIDHMPWCRFNCLKMKWHLRSVYLLCKHSALKGDITVLCVMPWRCLMFSIYQKFTDCVPFSLRITLEKESSVNATVCKHATPFIAAA